MKPTPHTAVLLLSLLAAAACQSGTGDDKVLAEVDESPITEYDVQRTIETTIGKYAGSRLDAEGRRKVLKSLVSARAIAQAREKEMGARERAELGKNVADYREKELVRQYLARHTRPEPVSAEMVKKYYQEHPESFGGETTRSYEMITASRAPTDQERTGLIKALNGAGEDQDWPALVEKLKSAGHPLAFRRGQVNDQVLHARLRTLMNRLEPGKASDLTFVQQRPYLVRITGEKVAPTKPLSEVSAEIRRILSPVQLKKSVQAASQKVLKDANVVYHDQPKKGTKEVASR